MNLSLPFDFIFVYVFHFMSYKFFSYSVSLFLLSASVSIFHTLSLDFLASCSFSCGRFEICRWFPRKSHVGQLPKFINPVKGISFVLYEAISRCQSKSVWLKNILDISKEMNRAAIVNDDKPEREMCQPKRIKNDRTTKRASKDFLEFLRRFWIKEFWRVELILWIAIAKSQKDLFMRNSSIWTLIKRNGMKNHLKPMDNKLQLPQIYELLMSHVSFDAIKRNSRNVSLFSTNEMTFCVFYGYSEHERKIACRTKWNHIRRFQCLTFVELFVFLLLFFKAMTTKYLNSDAESCPAVPQRKEHDKQKQQKDM